MRLFLDFVEGMIAGVLVAAVVFGPALIVGRL